MCWTWRRRGDLGLTFVLVDEVANAMGGFGSELSLWRYKLLNGLLCVK